MNAQTNATQKDTRNRTRNGQTHRHLSGAVLVAIVMGLLFHQLRAASGVAFATGPYPEVQALNQLVTSGNGAEALDRVRSTAFELGGWAPAPGDEVVFDPYLSRKVRGTVVDFDELPYDCADPKVSADKDTCLEEFAAKERQVRFGQSLFTTPGDGGAVVRPSFDDLLSTYIEEVGHSWQEYLYETNGNGNGQRIRQTTIAESEYWGPGREYQVKSYILSLDGTLLTLSDQQRDVLRGQICDGYANPIGNEIPPYGAPEGWPNPQGWPVEQPTEAELAEFCSA